MPHGGRRAEWEQKFHQKFIVWISKEAILFLSYNYKQHEKQNYCNTRTDSNRQE